MRRQLKGRKKPPQLPVLCSWGGKYIFVLAMFLAIHAKQKLIVVSGFLQTIFYEIHRFNWVHIR